MSVTNREIDYSIVVPVMNEQENVKRLYSAIKKVMDKLTPAYEIIFIDDGSTDDTYKILHSTHKRDSKLKVIKFRGNFGQSPATAAGFELAAGKIIITMDGDLQNDPRDIPNILKKMSKGYDVVSGWRKNRKDKLILRKIPSKVANRIICKVTNVKLHDTGCALKAYRSNIIKKLNLYGEMHRFLPALARVEGAKIGEIEVNHHPRIFGVSKYNLTRTYKVIMDLMTLNIFIRYLNHPLYFFGKVATLLLMIALLMSVTILIGDYWLSFSVEEFNNLIAVDFLLFVTGFQLLFIGLIGHIIIKTGQKRRFFLIEKS